MPVIDTKFAVHATGAFNSARNQFAMKMSTPGYSAAIDVVSDGKYIYMKMPPGTFKLPAAKEWVRLPINTAAGRINVDQIVGPAGYLQYVRSTGGEVSVEDSEVIDGVPALHYRTHVAMPDVLSAASKDQRADMEAQLAGLSIDPADLANLRYDIDVWIGEDGLARRLKLSFDTGSMSLGGKMVIEMTLHDIGLPVTIEPPATNLVVDGKNVGLS